MHTSCDPENIYLQSFFSCVRCWTNKGVIGHVCVLWMQPDVTAPGVNILAAWSGATSPTGLPFDKRIVQYNIISGTSMACPHTTGVATLLRAAHHNWSPSAIQSAIITTG